MASRQLTIKTGVVNRLVKEVASYKAEADMLLKRVDKMEENKEDEYEVRQQRRVHADSLQMIPDSEKRLAKAIEDLQNVVDSSEDELKDSDEWKKAVESLEVAAAATKPVEGEPTSSN